MRSFSSALLVVAAGAASPIMAQSDLEQEIAKCAAMVGDLDRLSCYDAIARSRGLAGPRDLPTPATGVGAWIVRDQVNPMDDTRTVILTLLASSGRSQLGRQEVALILRCQSGKTEAYIEWHDYLGSEAYVTARIGSQEAQRRRWNLSTDHTATFYARDVPGFIQALVATDRFVAQVTPYSESPVTAVFDVNGLETAVKPLRETCGW